MGQDKDWIGRLEEDLKGFGIKFERWRDAAQKTGRWCPWVEDGAEAYMREWYDAEKSLSLIHI